MTVGRPVKYETPESMQRAIDAYFDEEEQITVTGLAMALDLTRQGLIEYEAKDQFSDTVKKAKQRIQAHVESVLMYGRNQTGAIFNLKNNFGWQDKNTTVIEGNLELNWGNSPVKRQD